MVKIQYPVPKTLQDCVQGSQTHSGSTVNHQKFEGKANYKLWIQHSGPKRAKTLQDCVQGSQTQSGLTVNHQNVEEKATPSKKSIANYKLALGVLFHSETRSDPETNEDETANSTDLAHLPMVESDTETIFPNLAPDLAPDLALDLAAETIDSDVIPCPYFDPTPMVESDTEITIPNLAPDLAPETIDMQTFLDICPNSVSTLVSEPDSGLVPALVLDPVPVLVPNPIPEVCSNTALGPKEKHPSKKA